MAAALDYVKSGVRDDTINIPRYPLSGIDIAPFRYRNIMVMRRIWLQVRNAVVPIVERAKKGNERTLTRILTRQKRRRKRTSLSSKMRSGVSGSTSVPAERR
jgi:hypothetical protein